MGISRRTFLKSTVATAVAANGSVLFAPDAVFGSDTVIIPPASHYGPFKAVVQNGVNGPALQPRIKVISLSYQLPELGQGEIATIPLPAGFGTPKFAIFERTSFHSIGGPPDINRNYGNGSYSWGCADAAGNQFAIGHMLDGEAGGDTNCNRTMSNISCIRRMNFNPFGEVDESWSIHSFGIDYIKIQAVADNSEPQQGETQPSWVTVTAYTGPGILNAKAFDWDDLGTDNQPIPITGIGFEGSAAFLATVSLNLPLSTFDDVNDSGRPQAHSSVGMAVNKPGNPQGCWALHEDDDTTQTHPTTMVSNTAAIASTLSGAIEWSVTIDNWGPDGFDATPSASTDSSIFGGLVVEFSDDVDFNLVEVSIPTSGGYSQTDVGFEPIAGHIHLMAGPSAVNTATQTHNCLTMTSFSKDKDLNTFVRTVHETNRGNNETPTPFTSTGGYYDTLISLESNPSGTDTIVFNTSSFTTDSAGWDAVVTTHPSSAILGFAFAISNGGFTDPTKSK
jgi:hypothetical protein